MRFRSLLPLAVFLLAAPAGCSRNLVLAPAPTAISAPFAYDPFYYDTYYPRLRRVELPTEDMVTMALPEGVVRPRGRVGGFLYFQPLDDDVEHVTFRARFVTAHRGEEIGTVSIPFVAAG